MHRSTFCRRGAKPRESYVVCYFPKGIDVRLIAITSQRHLAATKRELFIVAAILILTVAILKGV